MSQNGTLWFNAGFALVFLSAIILYSNQKISATPYRVYFYMFFNDIFALFLSSNFYSITIKILPILFQFRHICGIIYIISLQKEKITGIAEGKYG